MIEITIKFTDEGWHVGFEFPGAGKDEVKGGCFGHTFDRFDEAVQAALDEIAKYDNGVIKMTGSAAKTASRDLEKDLA